MNTFSQRRVAFRLRRLFDDFRTLIASFPDLRDAFDPDELPLAFILERDSKRARPSPTRKAIPRRPALVAISRPATRTGNRRRREKKADE